ncbi:hypothetical protein NHL50_08640 [Acidimicrobiia bacterium EGI L10123]|uniref:hypothetical protein n=1 Tax=Salinilacustrithrix flava TaxID=2957203 RepID=UPI003D7C2B19|nr:hypothetical protein [Acidimicrobiia bacterium EGI L10123]
MKALFPYPTLFGDVTLSVTEVAIDDEPVAGRVDVDRRVVNLYGIDRAEWETARVSVVVSAPANEIEDADAPQCVAVTNCGPSNQRVSSILAPDGGTTGRWAGEILLEREYWYAHAELRAGVVATVDGAGHRVVGNSDTWTVMFDDLPNRPVNGAIKITWVDFSDPGDDKQYLQKHSDNYVYLSIDPEEPQLFLNRSFDGLEQLLADRRRRHLDRALHDQTRASIADKTWSALFNAAIESVEVDEETGEPTWPSVEWQRTVLEALLVRMYPDKAPEEALGNAWTARNTRDNPGTLQELLAPAAAVQARAPRLLRDGIRIIANELEADEEEQTQ